MAKVKIVGTNLDENLNRENFNNIPSQTIFSFGRFSVTSNFDGRRFIDYTNALTNFVKPITLETLDLSDIQSEIVLNKATDVVLNLDKSDFKSFVRFGSAYEFLRVAVEDIILKYPASLYISSSNVRGGSDTIFNLEHDTTTNITTFNINSDAIINEYGIIYGEYETPVVLDDNEIRNLTLSYERYVVWIEGDELEVTVPIIGYTGNTNNSLITIKTLGNPFEEFDDVLNMSFHIKPNNIVFEEFRQQLSDFQIYMLSKRTDDNEGFEFTMKDPILTDSGNIIYNDNLMIWGTSDGYNLEFNTSDYRQFLERLLIIGSKYDKIKTDLIARFLTPTSIKTYDLTEEGKITKLLRIYGREFDQMREFIDSLAYINRVTYDKLNNAPDQIIANLAKTMGWDYFSLVNEQELVETLLTIDDTERNLNTELLPIEIDIELWRRIIINTSYFWKTKGTREAVKAIFLMIGIPEPFINITEYVYTVEGRIDPRQVELLPIDFGSEVYPFDDNGYPKAPIETSEFYFQLSGNTDSGQAYMDNFRKAGFSLERTVDNKKSWLQAGEIIRRHPSSPEYYQADSKLVLNTKEVDVALDAARGIEFDVYEYIKQDWLANSTGATVPYSYVNISLDVGDGYTFPLPPLYNDATKVQGDLEVRFNGILLNSPVEYDPITGSTSATTFADYIIDESTKTFTLLTASASTSPNRRDVIQATFVYSGDTSPITGVSVQYVVTRISTNGQLLVVDLPTAARGHVQLTINGIALTRGTSQFTADYVVNPNNPSQLVIQNPAVVNYVNNTPQSFVQVAYLEVSGSTTIEARNEIHRVDGFSSSKFYFNALANRFVYVMNYRVKSAENIKVLIDGVALEPRTDYTINTNNPFEIFLPRGIKFGSVISVYYLIGGDEFLNPVIDDLFGLGDITELSFLQFLELVERRMINARTRQTISDFKGGWYPTLLRIYNEYLKRGDVEGQLQSNAYTFQNLFPFLRKYNSFFDKFIKQLLSATIITKRSGLLVRNTLFSRQKYMYKRGVAFNYRADRRKGDPVEFNTTLNYVGDDGSVFLIPQQATTLTPSLNTIEGMAGTTTITNTGGDNIVMFDAAQRFGMEYRVLGTGAWLLSPDPPYEKAFFEGSEILTPTPVVGSTSFTQHTITGLDPETTYEYRAFIEINGVKTYGQIRQATTEAIPLPTPSVQTVQGTAVRDDLVKPTAFSIAGTGGNNIVRANDVDFYGMQYREGTSGPWLLSPDPSFNASVTPIVNNQFSHTIGNLIQNTTYQYRAFINVGGQNFFGQTRQLTMLGLPVAPPSVQTGDVGIIGTTTINVNENKVTDDNNSPILEHGVIWTHSSFVGNSPSTFNTGNTTVTKVQSLTVVPVGDPFTVQLVDLTPNTQTWFRAYARNAVGLTYGSIKSAVTAFPPEPITRTLNFTIIPDPSITGSFNGTYTIKKVSDNTIIKSVTVPMTFVEYEVVFDDLPNEDYYIDAYSLTLYNNDLPQQAVLAEFFWDIDGDALNGPNTTYPLTNPVHFVTLNLNAPPAP